MSVCATCGGLIERITEQCNLARDLSYHRGPGCCPGCQRHVVSTPDEGSGPIQNAKDRAKRALVRDLLSGSFS